MSQHWKELSNDPNDSRVRRWRRERLAAARSRTLVADRVEYLCALARNRKVLDIGCVEHFAEASARRDWLHGRVAQAAHSCLGVDILPEEVRTLAAKGYNVRLADVAAEPLAEQFEVIICGELLEHVEAPGRLFSSVTRMLQPGGVFVLTTPFPWYFGWMVKNLFDGAPPVGSVDHVAWYDPGTLAELADRHGLHLCFYAGVADKDPSARLRFAKSCLKAFTHLGLRPEILSRSVLYQFARERAL